MATPQIEILGAYKLEFSDEQIRGFITDSFGDSLDAVEISVLLNSKREELASIVAFDIHVQGADDTFDVGDFVQPDTDQAAYDEVYLSLQNHPCTSHLAPPDPDNFRIYFFMHFVDVQKPLLSSYGELAIPELKPLPDHLGEIHPYTSID